MFKKGTKLYCILSGTCPKCHEESMYKNKNPYILSEALSMHETCNNCNTKYKIEPSFFYGAMYVSYGLNVAVGVAAFIIANVFLSLDLVQSFIAIIGMVILAFPFVVRWARNIYINMFVSFDKKFRK